jgi:pimeloyl-ACP methyl ester carboxylesterase
VWIFGGFKLKFLWNKRVVAWTCLITVLNGSISFGQTADYRPTPPSPFIKNSPVPQSSNLTESVINNYKRTFQLASQYYRSAKDDASKSMIESLMIVPPEAYDPHFNPLSYAQEQHFLNDADEIYSSPRAIVVAHQLKMDATRTYLNQTMLKWLRMRKQFTGSLPVVDSNPHVQKAYQYVQGLLKGTESFTTEEWNQQGLWFNADIKMMDDICDWYNENLETIAFGRTWYDELKKKPDFKLGNYPELQRILYPDGNTNSVNGGLEDRFKVRASQEKTFAAHDVSAYHLALSASPIGELLAGPTKLRATVGDFKPSECAVKGKTGLKKLGRGYRELVKYSVVQMEDEYEKTIAQLVDDLENENSEEVLLKYITENPTSIQMSLLAHPNPEAVQLLAGIIRQKERDDARALRRNVGITLLTLPLVAVKGIQASIYASQIMFAVSTYYAASTVLDMRTASQMEERIKLSMLSNQISKERGTAILESISNMKPMSWVNLALCGLSAVGSAVRIRQLVSYDKYLNATTGSQLGSKLSLQIKPNGGGGSELSTTSVDDILAWVNRNTVKTPPRGPSGYSSGQSTIVATKPITAVARPSVTQSTKSFVNNSSPLQPKMEGIPYIGDPIREILPYIPIIPLSPPSLDAQRINVNEDVVSHVGDRISESNGNLISIPKDHISEAENILQNRKPYDPKFREALCHLKDHGKTAQIRIDAEQLLSANGVHCAPSAKGGYAGVLDNLTYSSNSKIKLVGKIENEIEQSIFDDLILNQFDWSKTEAYKVRTIRSQNYFRVRAFTTQAGTTYYAIKNPKNDLINANRDYEATKLCGELIPQYCIPGVLIEDQTNRYFVTRELKSLRLNYKNNSGNKLMDVPAENLAYIASQEYGFNRIFDYSLPEVIFLFDLLIGYTDRGVDANVLILNHPPITEVFNSKKLPIHIQDGHKDFAIFDFAGAFAFDNPLDVRFDPENRTNFFKIFDGYFPGQKMPEDLKKFVTDILLQNPEFVESLESLDPDNFSMLTNYQRNILIQNRQTMLNWVEESRLRSPASASETNLTNENPNTATTKPIATNRIKDAKAWIEKWNAGQIEPELKGRIKAEYVPEFSTPRLFPATGRIPANAQARVLALHGMGANTANSKATAYMLSQLGNADTGEAGSTLQYLQRLSTHVPLAIEAIDLPKHGFNEAQDQFNTLDSVVEYLAIYIRQMKQETPYLPLYVYARSATAMFVSAVNAKYPGLIDGMIFDSPELPGRPDLEARQEESMRKSLESADKVFNKEIHDWYKRLTRQIQWTPDYFGNTPLLILTGSLDAELLPEERQQYQWLADHGINTLYMDIEGAGHIVFNTRRPYRNAGREAYGLFYDFLVEHAENKPELTPREEVQNIILGNVTFKFSEVVIAEMKSIFKTNGMLAQHLTRWIQNDITTSGSFLAALKEQVMSSVLNNPNANETVGQYTAIQWIAKYAADADPAKKIAQNWLDERKKSQQEAMNFIHESVKKNQQTGKDSFNTKISGHQVEIIVHEREINIVEVMAHPDGSSTNFMFGFSYEVDSEGRAQVKLENIFLLTRKNGLLYHSKLFNGSNLIDFMFDYVENTKSYPINQINEFWLNFPANDPELSQMFHEFYRLVNEKGMSYARAAASTFTGSIYTSRGFTINNDDIIIDDNSPSPSDVSVQFHRDVKASAQSEPTASVGNVPSISTPKSNSPDDLKLKSDRQKIEMMVHSQMPFEVNDTVLFTMNQMLKEKSSISSEIEKWIRSHIDPNDSIGKQLNDLITPILANENRHERMGQYVAAQWIANYSNETHPLRQQAQSWINLRAQQQDKIKTWLLEQAESYRQNPAAEVRAMPNSNITVQIKNDTFELIEKLGSHNLLQFTFVFTPSANGKWSVSPTYFLKYESGENVYHSHVNGKDMIEFMFYFIENIKGGTIDEISELWVGRHCDMYNEYWINHDNGMNDLEAIRNTWSGRLYNAHGLDPILEGKKYERDRLFMVLFKRNENAIQNKKLIEHANFFHDLLINSRAKASVVDPQDSYIDTFGKLFGGLSYGQLRTLHLAMQFDLINMQKLLTFLNDGAASAASKLTKEMLLAVNGKNNPIVKMEIDEIIKQLNSGTSRPYRNTSVILNWNLPLETIEQKILAKPFQISNDQINPLDIYQMQFKGALEQKIYPILRQLWAAKPGIFLPQSVTEMKENPGKLPEKFLAKISQLFPDFVQNLARVLITDIDLTQEDFVSLSYKPTFLLQYTESQKIAHEGSMNASDYLLHDVIHIRLNHEQYQSIYQDFTRYYRQDHSLMDDLWSFMTYYQNELQSREVIFKRYTFLRILIDKFHKNERDWKTFKNIWTISHEQQMMYEILFDYPVINIWSTSFLLSVSDERWEQIIKIMQQQSAKGDWGSTEPTRDDYFRVINSLREIAQEYREFLP